MKLPIETKPALWGIAGGAAAMAFVGFTWGGWVTGGKAEVQAKQREDAAIVATLAPQCVARFQASADAAGHLTALKKAESWSQGDYVEKGGWATAPGATPNGQVSQVARACAALLVA